MQVQLALGPVLHALALIADFVVVVRIIWRLQI